MISSQTSALALHLNKNSTPIALTENRIDWSALTRKELWLPESMLSLYGTAEFEQLSKSQRIKLSHVELLYFVEFGIWLESIFINRLRDTIDVNDVTPCNLYNLVIIKEEAEHSLMFLEFMKNSGYDRPALINQSLNIYRKIWSFATINSSLFWTFVLAGEEIPLRMNKAILKERKSLNSTVANIVKIHTLDESRHVSHASSMLSDTLKTSHTFTKSLIRFFAPKLIKQFTDAFYYPSQDVYDAADLDDKINWCAIAHNNKSRKVYIDNQLNNILRPLKSYNLY